MNLLKSFSVTTGLEPKAGYIYEKFYPLDFDKYIVLDTQSTDPNYHYVFWFRAIELMEPILKAHGINICLLYTSPSPRDRQKSRMPSSA